MSERVPLLLAGHPGTGKSVCAQYLASERGYTLFEGSKHIREKAFTDYGLSLKTRIEYNLFFRLMQHERGVDWLGRAFLSLDAPRSVFSGARVTWDVELLRSEGGVLIALDCPPEIALARMDKNSPKHPRTLEEYSEHCAMDDNPGPSGFNVSTVLSMADHRIDTSQPNEAVYAQLAHIAITYEQAVQHPGQQG